MVVEEEALQEGVMVAAAADMEGAKNRIKEAFWSEIFLLIAGLCLYQFYVIGIVSCSFGLNSNFMLILKGFLC